MMTIVTHLRIKEGQEPAWDAAFRERVQVAKERQGFCGVQLCIPIDAMSERVIIGTWRAEPTGKPGTTPTPFVRRASRWRRRTRSGARSGGTRW